MIFDISLYLAQLAEEISWQRTDIISRVCSIEQTWPIFRNVAYALSATPIVIDKRWHHDHQASMGAYLTLLEKTILLCLRHRELSDYLGHSDIDRAFIATPLRAKRFITICRLDGYVDRACGQLKLLEHNSDSPAGILFSPRLNALVEHLWARFGNISLRDHLGAHQFDDTAQVQSIFASAVGSEDSTLAILQESGKANTESPEMATQFSNAGLESCVTDPRDIEMGKDGIFSNSKRIGAFWNKINTVYWQRFIERNPNQIDKWLRILNDGDVSHLNHFGARLVTENKRCLALLQEERFSHYFSDTERELISRMHPWARKFESGKSVLWRGEKLDMVDLARAHPESFVIKEPYDIRGDGVTIGRGCTSTDWKSKVDAAQHEGYVLQEYIAPTQLPVAHADERTAMSICNSSLDTFMFEGKVVGYGAKVSTNHHVNLFKGGRKVAVLVGS